MSDNPFASFSIELPKAYDDEIRKYCKSGGGKVTPEFSPFERQVDFWYLAFLLGAAKRLDPKKEDDTYKITPASILSSDPYRIAYMQSVFLGLTKDVEGLASARNVFDFCNGLAMAGIPHLLQILRDEDQRPLWNVLDEIEEMVG